jgi:PH/SEC7 domain-containing protein
MSIFPELEPSLVETSIGEVDEPPSPTSPRPPMPVTSRPDQKTAKPVQRSLSDRYSYRAAIYKSDTDHDLM